MHEYQPKMLLKTRSYPAYQFAESLKYTNETNEKCMCYTILCIMEWLQKKIGDVQSAPALETPSPDHFGETTLTAFSSFHFNEGCTVDITSIPSQGIWALQIKEPEVNQDTRSAVIGRFYVTNVGLYLSNDAVELGVQVTILDPINSKDEADFAYRPGFLRKLFSNKKINLTQVTRLSFNKSIIIHSERELIQLFDLIENSNNQLPIVILTYAIERQSVQSLVDKLDKALNLVNSPQSFKTKLLSLTNTPVDLNFRNAVLPYDADYMAFQLFGYGRIYTLAEELLPSMEQILSEKILPGDVVIIEPKCFGKSIFVKKYNPRLSVPGRERIRAEIIHSIQSYSKHKRYDFGNVVFELSARRLEIEERIKSHVNSARSGEQNRIDEIYSETDRLLAVYDQEKKNLLSELESLTEEVRNWVSKSTYLEERLKQTKSSGLCFKVPEIVEMYPDELYDLVISVMRNIRGNYRPEGSRAEELIDAFLSVNPIVGTGADIFEHLKSILYRDKNLSDADISELESLGFNISRHSNNHYRLNFRNDQRHSFTLASTGSDVRGMKNSFSEIVQQLSVYK